MLSKGQKINDRYEIIKSIGEGGMANVYLAHDSILDRKVAIKVLRGDLENNEKFIRRFQREAKSVSDLSHPNIVEVYDVGEEEGQHYIVMEYIDGRTLKQLIQKRGALTVAEVLDIMTQLTDGLAAAHEAYIIHRDIKPQNIMILDNGMVKITDFGIAMTLNATQLTQTNSVMGSVHYLPPEQASGQTATTKSDIYSSGILMYELLTGSVPFKGDNAVEIALKQMKERIPSIRKQNPLIPQSVENIVLKATAKNPKNRYDSIKDMHDDLVHALDPERQNETRYKYPYPESEMDESKEIPIKEPEEEIYQPKSEIEKPKSNENTSNKENKKLNIIILIALILFLILIGAIFYFNHRNNNATVIVPNVSKLKTSQAKKKLKEKGFKFSVEEKEDDKIKKGYTIYLTNEENGKNKLIDFNLTAEEFNNIILLDNDSYQDDYIYIAGLTLPSKYYYNITYDESSDILLEHIQHHQELISKLPARLPKVLLIHSPIKLTDEEVLNKLSSYDLILSGHTHAGMVPDFLNKFFKKNTGIIAPNKKWFPEISRGKIEKMRKGKRITIIITGGITKLSLKSSKLLSKLNFVYNISINKIIITKKRGKYYE